MVNTIGYVHKLAANNVGACSDIGYDGQVNVKVHELCMHLYWNTKRYKDNIVRSRNYWR